MYFPHKKQWLRLCILCFTSLQAYAPNYPFPRDEHWIFIVADPSNNTVLGWARVGLVEAESIGARYAASWVSKTTVGAAPRSTGGPSLVLASSAGDGDGAPEESEEALVERVGQRIEIKFLAPPPGKHDLALYVMCDSWVGADRAVPLKLRTVEATRAQREGRAAAAAAAATGPKARSKAPSAVQRSEESELALAEDAGDDVSDAGDYSGSEGEGSDDDEGSSEGEHDWDSDEYGTEESGDEDDIEGEEIVSDGEN